MIDNIQFPGTTSVSGTRLLQSFIVLCQPEARFVQPYGQPPRDDSFLQGYPGAFKVLYRNTMEALSVGLVEPLNFCTEFLGRGELCHFSVLEAYSHNAQVQDKARIASTTHLSSARCGDSSSQAGSRQVYLWFPTSLRVGLR